ncbi:DUF6443 domain-containing protein, partial [Hymenobacter terrestris]
MTHLRAGLRLRGAHLFVLLVLAGGLPGSGVAQSLPDSAKVRILRQLYLGTGGDQWSRRANWPTAAQWQTPGFADTLASRHFRTWQGLEVYGSQIYGVHLAVNNLRGAFPASLLELGADLVQLHLNNNQLTGQLPPNLGNLSGISILDMNTNQLSGPLPASLSQLRTVYILGLAQNQFTGSLPQDIGNLTGAVIFNLSNNRLSGPLPASMGQMYSLGYCHLDNNQFSGSLPASLGQLTHLSYLTLPNNRLTGVIPASILSLPTSTTIQLHNNELTGVEPLAAGPFPNNPNLGGNYLGFEALEQLLTGPGQPKHPYFPAPNQRQRLLRADTLALVKGQSKTLAGALPGQHNHYQWERRVGQAWVDLADQTQPTLLVHVQGESEEGEYRTRVTNDWVPNVTLYGRGQYVTLLPYAPLALNEPKDGDCPAPPNGPLPVNRDPGQTDSVNYVRTYSARKAFTNPADLKTASTDEVQVSTQYLDGLGRPMQTVQHRASPAGRDLVQHTEYDALGREPKQYLPYSADPATADAVRYHPDAKAEQAQFYRGQGGRDPLLPQLTATLPKTSVAYTETVFESSPLNRPRVQASPGETWQVGKGHETTLQERPNVAGDSVMRYTPDYGPDREELKYEGTYAPGELWVKTSRDEQGQWRQEFTDKQGQVVLSQVGLDGSYQQPATSWLKTYYVFDDFGRLRAVLPPLSVQRLRKNNWLVTGAGIERLLFRYHYDARGRLVEKQVPDQAGYSYVIYNELDQPILTQQVSQQATKEWVATKYDALGRVIYTGLVRFDALSGTPSQQYTQLLGWQANWLASNASIPLWEEPSATATMGRAYYSARSWPALGASGAELLSVTYYDHYDFNQDGQPDVAYQPPTAEQLGG